MRLSLIISFLLHCSLLLAGVVALPAAEEFVVEDTEAVPVDILTLSEFSKLRAQSPDVKPEPKEKPAPPEQKEVKQPPPPEPEPEPEPEPKVAAAAEPPPPPPEPEPEPEPEAKPEPKVEPEKKVEAKPVPKPRRRPKPPKKVAKKKRKFDVDRIAALLNKNQENQPPPPAVAEPAQPAPGPETRLRGSDDTISQNEKDALRRQIEACWSPPVGVEEAGDLVVRVRISLRRDGSLSRPPKVVNSSSNPIFQVASEAAIRAVRKCEPFDMPASKYNVWRDIILNFNPKKMLQG